MIDGHIAKWLVTSELARILDKDFLEVVDYVEQSVHGTEEISFQSMVNLLRRSGLAYFNSEENGSV